MHFISISKLASVETVVTFQMSNFFVRKRKPDLGDGWRHKKQTKFQKRSEKSTTESCGKGIVVRKKRKEENEEIVSSESEYDERSVGEDNELESGGEKSEEETAQQTKLRMAKMYIEQVREKVRLGLESSDRKRQFQQGTTTSCFYALLIDTVTVLLMDTSVLQSLIAAASYSVRCSSFL